MQNPSYVIITPAKDEESNIESTIKSVLAQTLKPKKWIIVDDGSTDKTASIVKKHANSYDWMIYVKSRSGPTDRAGGTKIVAAFYAGYEVIQADIFDFIVKLDADIILPLDYFEQVGHAFSRNSRVGLCGGYCVIDRNGRMVTERSHSQHLRGAIKAYRRECFDQIGGIPRVHNWDGLDQILARFHGWEIEILPVKVIHQKETGSTLNPIRSNFIDGISYYKTGYGFFISCLSALSRSFAGPFYSGFFYFAGVFWAWMIREPWVVDKEVARFARKLQFDRLFKFKRKKSLNI